MGIMDVRNFLLSKGDVSMNALPYRKVNRHHIYEEIKNMIQSNPEKEAEVSSSELADRFNVQAPTMDYHLNKLIDEGLLTLSPKRGRYNRKIYRLPSTPAQEKEEPKTEIVTPESAEKFKQFLEKHIKKTAPKEVFEQKEENVQETFDLDTEIKDSPKKEELVLEVKELSLDQRITRFLEEANQVHDAHMLLKHEDKEVLSVMNETIQQTTVYLKDLSEQLSTIQNKQLIQHLIDDRNRMQQQMERLEQDVQEARSQVDQTIEKYEIEPNRVRFMHQLIISTVDDYVNLPNHALALGRAEFRTKASKEVSDLVKYVLHLEE